MALPVSSKVKAALDRQEETERAARAAPLGAVPRDRLAATAALLKTTHAEEDASLAEFESVNESISDILRERRQRRDVRWLRWLPVRETDVDLDALRQQRDALRVICGALAQKRLAAEVAEEKARQHYGQLIAERDAKRKAAVAAADRRLAIVARARKLLALLPMLASVGARRLVGAAARIEKAREQGWDPGMPADQVAPFGRT